MLPRAQRLTAKTDIAKTYRTGKRMYGTYMMLFALKQGTEPTKATVVVSKKVAKSAVKRNRIKRQLREILKEHLPQQGYFIILQAKNSATNATFDALHSDGAHLFGKARLAKVDEVVSDHSVDHQHSSK